jgi:hypothetical protein
MLLVDSAVKSCQAVSPANVNLQCSVRDIVSAAIIRVAMNPDVEDRDMKRLRCIQLL